MKKYDFVRMVAKRTGFTIANTTKAFDAIVETIHDVVIDADDVLLENVGKIQGVVVPAHEKNCFGEGVKVIPERITLKFKPSAKFKNELRMNKAQKFSEE